MADRPYRAGEDIMRRLIPAALAAAMVAAGGTASAQSPDPNFEARTLDGSNNNRAHPGWGRTGTPYLRLAGTNYADGVRTPIGGPSPRWVSNRVFQDGAQNLFSESSVTQWGFVWGQFMDHTFGLREQKGGEVANLPFDASDPLELFRNDLGAI